MKYYDNMRENLMKKQTGKLNNLLAIRKASADEPTTEVTKAEGASETEPDASKSEADNAPDFSLLKDAKVATIVQHARTEEKQKVNKELDKQKAKISTLEGQVTTLTQQLGQATVDNTALKGEMDALVKQNALSADEKVKAVQTKLDTANNELAKITGELAVTKSKLDSTVLEGYAKGKIAEAGGKIVVEMVSGSTVEEIDASVEKAKATYESYFKGQATPPATETNPKKTAGVTGTPERTTNEADFTSYVDLMKNPKKAIEYAKIRDVR